MNNGNRLSAVFATFGMAVFSRDESGSFVPAGRLPPWWSQLNHDPDRFQPNDDWPYLLNFLEDAERFWSSESTKRVSSGAWQKTLPSGETIHLEAHAVRDQATRLLVVENLDSRAGSWREALQIGREVHLRSLEELAKRDQLQMQLKSAQEASEQLERARQEMIAKVSHELRTPLTAIQSAVDLANETEVPLVTRNLLHTIGRSADSLTRLVADLLDFAALETGEMSLEVRPVSPTKMIEELVEDFTKAASEKQLELRAIIEPSTPPIIEADAQRLRQVLNNLTHNAIKYTRQGAVIIKSTGNVSTDEIQFEVSDTGPGIPFDQQQIIFDAFARSPAAYDQPGTGLGLSIARHLVASLGGQLKLVSDPHAGGSAFSFCLPTNHPPSTSVVPLPDPTDQARHSDLADALVLVAEDNAVNRALVVRLLGKANLKTLEASDGRQAVELVCQHHPQAVLMDCRMPGLNGFEAVRQIRDHDRESGAYTPIIAVTAHAMADDEVRCRKAGMDDYLVKPFTKKGLLDKISRVVSLHCEPQVRIHD